MLDLAGGRLLVDAALAALLELEVLDRIREVDLAAVEPGLRQRPVEGAGRPARRRAGPADPPGRPAARRRRRSSASAGPSPTTAWVAPGTSGSERRDERVELVERSGLAGPRMASSAFSGCAFRRHRRLLLDHRGNALRGRSDQAGDGGGLGQVAPVLLRHLGPHQPRVEARRVEDALVIAAPARLEARRPPARPRARAGRARR